MENGQYVCTVVAIGADMLTRSSYVVKVKSNHTTICDQLTAVKHPTAYFTLDGRQAKTLVPGKIYICRQADGTIAKIRR
jgi:hypothetical protein